MIILCNLDNFFFTIYSGKSTKCAKGRFFSCYYLHVTGLGKYLDQGFGTLSFCCNSVDYVIYFGGLSLNL